MLMNYGIVHARIRVVWELVSRARISGFFSVDNYKRQNCVGTFKTFHLKPFPVVYTDRKCDVLSSMNQIKAFMGGEKAFIDITNQN